MILEANVNVLKLLKDFYEHLVVDENFPWKENCKDHVIAFSDQLNVMVYDLETDISRAKLLNRIIADRKALVIITVKSWSSRHANKNVGKGAYSSPKYGKNGGIDCQYGRARSYGSKRGHRDANNHGSDRNLSSGNICLCKHQTQNFIVSKRLMLLQTFFSTEIMNYNNGGGFSKAAMVGWFEVTIPLTAVTLGLCYFLFKRSTRQKLKRLGEVLKTQTSKLAKS
jgi:hypothetical protein